VVDLAVSGLQLDLMVLKVLSSLNDSLILKSYRKLWDTSAIDFISVAWEKY